ncbi:hypothetical protein HYC85_017835 [Camellia sinensis]|uniref:Uncharacterized protein n=1 Tax=Camellia sinensis TaxID=4442 RepID=A0A7J7GWG0_CAMSI|nr:hypothetical protein HYC85_017835 [Camellia sinensis]
MSGDEAKKFVANLMDEVAMLKWKNEMQAVNLVEGFESIFKVKDKEIKKLSEENTKLKRTVACLEEQLANQAVHNVTQRYNGFISEAVGEMVPERDDGRGLQGVGSDGKSVCSDVMVNASPLSYLHGFRCSGETDVNAGVGQVGEHEVVVISLVIGDGGALDDGMNSFVHNIKEKVRKNLKLPEFEYPEVRLRHRKVGNKGESARDDIVGRGLDRVECDDVIDV